VEVNRVACEMLGYTREELVRLGPADVDARFGAAAPPRMEQLQEIGREFAESEHRRKGGTTVPTEITTVAFDYGGEPAFLSVVRDITRRRQLEEQLLRSQKMEAVGRLAGGIAHDFNNLLTAILGYAEMALESDGLGDAAAGSIDEIRRAAQRSTALTRRLLAFSRTRLLRPRGIDVGRLIEDIKSMLLRLIGEDVRLVTSCEEAGLCVRGDPGQIEQVLMNLAINARDAMPAGGVLEVSVEGLEIRGTIEVAYPEADPGSYVRITVSDEG